MSLGSLFAGLTKELVTALTTESPPGRVISLQRHLETFKKILSANLRKSITICQLSERT